MFRRTLTCALAIGCALSLSACNTTTDQVKFDAVVAKAAVTTSKVKAYALKADAICHGVVPTVESVTSILAAVATAEMAVDLACKALDVGVAYTADSPAPLPPKKPKRGETVTGTVVVNGKLVPVAGTVAK